MVDEPQDESPPPSAPETFGVFVRDWNGEATAQQLAECPGGLLLEDAEPFGTLKAQCADIAERANRQSGPVRVWR